MDLCGRVNHIVGIDTRQGEGCWWGSVGFSFTFSRVGKRIFFLLSLYSFSQPGSPHWERISGGKGNPGFEKWEQLGFGDRTASAQPTQWPCDCKSLWFKIWKAKECLLVLPVATVWGWGRCDVSETSRRFWMCWNAHDPTEQTWEDWLLHLGQQSQNSLFKDNRPVFWSQNKSRF